MKEKLVWLGTAGLPAAALAVFLLLGSAVPIHAEEGEGSCPTGECKAESKCWGNGYCLETGCQPPLVTQKCVQGTWGQCGGC
jgi:hypothetical protein